MGADFLDPLTCYARAMRVAISLISSPHSAEQRKSWLLMMDKRKCDFSPGGDTHIKSTGVLVGNFEKTPEEVLRFWFVSVAWLFLIEVPVLKQLTIYLSPVIFSAQYPKRNRKSFWCGPFEAEHLKSYQNRLFTPKRHDEHPYLFYMGVHSPGFLVLCIL